MGAGKTPAKLVPITGKGILCYALIAGLCWFVIPPLLGAFYLTLPFIDYELVVFSLLLFWIPTSVGVTTLTLPLFFHRMHWGWFFLTVSFITPLGSALANATSSENGYDFLLQTVGTYFMGSLYAVPMFLPCIITFTAFYAWAHRKGKLRPQTSSKTEPAPTG